MWSGLPRCAQGDTANEIFGVALAEFMEKSSTAAVAENWAEKRKPKRCRLMEKLLVRTRDGVAHIGTSFEVSQGTSREYW